MKDDDSQRDKRNDSCVDFEEIARRDKASKLESVASANLDPALDRLITSIKTGEDEREAYFHAVRKLVDFLEMAAADLEDVGALSWDHPEDYALGRSLGMASCLAEHRPDLAEEMSAEIHRLISEVGENEEDQ